MRRHVDPDGRVYRSIRSGGRVYTYYDDDPVPPTDVWDDVSHLQQRDPQRTGYDTQKPLALLERIVRCASREGELVFDPFAGSGTTLEAACRLGRRFLGVDKCPLVPNILRRRLEGAPWELLLRGRYGRRALATVDVLRGVGFYHFDASAIMPMPWEMLDNWALGYLQGEEIARALAGRAHEKASRNCRANWKCPSTTARSACAFPTCAEKVTIIELRCEKN